MNDESELEGFGLRMNDLCWSDKGIWGENMKKGKETKEKKSKEKMNE
jgi:hypothetical protein